MKPSRLGERNAKFAAEWADPGQVGGVKRLAERIGEYEALIGAEAVRRDLTSRWGSEDVGSPLAWMSGRPVEGP